MKPAWEILRKDRNKALTKEEFLAECPRALPEIVDGLYRTFDTNSPRMAISYNEMCAYVLLAGDRGGAEEKIESLFPICDLNGDNCISFEELENALKMLYTARFQGDQEYVDFKVEKIMEEVRSVAERADKEPMIAEAVQAEDSTEDTPPQLTDGAVDDDAAVKALANRPIVSASHFATVEQRPIDAAAQDKADSEVQLAQDDSEIPTLRKFTEWARSNNRPDDAAAQAKADSELQLAQDDSEILTLRKFTEWARSNHRHVSELRELLQQPIVSSEGGEEENWETFSMQAHMKFERIKVEHPVVELDGDEMTRVMWGQIKQNLIHPFLDMEIDYYDLGITFRDETQDEITHQAAAAIQRFNVGIKCPTIIPDQNRAMEFSLQKQWPDPNSTIQNILDGTTFHVPVVVKNIPRYVPGWKKPIIIGRHTYGEQCQASQLTTKPDRPGTFKLVFEPEDGEKEEVAAYNFTHQSEGGVMMGVYNTRKSVRHFAKCCFEYALSQGMPLYLSTKNNTLEAYDGLFFDVFNDMYNKTYKKTFEDKNLWYQHRIIDDMVSQVMKSSGGFVWACKNYDGDVMADVVAQGYGSLGLMSSVLVCPDGKTVLTQAGHGTVTRHFRSFQRGEKISTNPIACIFAWTRGLAHRAKLDRNDRLEQFSLAVEEACVDCVQNGQFSKDLAICVHGAEATPDQWLLTEDLLKEIANRLRIVLGRGLRGETHSQEVPFEPRDAEQPQVAA
jgi:isocitrate dehydrogenase